LLEAVVGAGEPLLIIAEDVEGRLMACPHVDNMLFPIYSFNQVLTGKTR
jgi:hypothetical protein